MTTFEHHYLVALHDKRVGMLHARNDYTRFVFDEDYVNDPNRAVLGLRFEEDLHAQQRSNMRLPPWFSNLLPEGRLRQWVAQTRGVSESREMQLLAELGHDLPGAVQVTEIHVETEPRSVGQQEVVSSVGKELTSLGKWRFSLAGVALKLSMLQDGDRFTAPGFGDGGDWIVKLPDHTYPLVPLNEFAMMTLARICGLLVPDIQLVHREQLDDVPERLWPEGEDRAYAVRRFDRAPDRKRIHIEDLAQVRGFYPEQKYSGSFETVGALIYRYRDRRSLIEFAKRLAFNILIGNGDAHLKNWSLLYRNPRAPELAPAYDLVATAIYRPTHSPEDLGLKFGGTRRFGAISLRDFESLARRLRVPDIPMADIVREFTECVHTHWPEAAELLKEHPTMVDGIHDHLIRRTKSLLGAH